MRCPLHSLTRSSGLPLPRRAPGKADGKLDDAGACTLHALLPTKIVLPFAAHLQGPWLLSVDRQDVQSLQDSPWNACIARQLPALLVTALRHIAGTIGQRLSSKAGEGSRKDGLLADGGLAASYALLPNTIERVPPPTATSASRPRQGSKPPPTPPLALSLLGVELDLSPLDQALGTEPLVPVLGLPAGGGSLCDLSYVQRELHFVKAGDACLLSSHLLKWLPTGLLRKWLNGRLPLAHPMLGSAGASPLWQLLHQPYTATAATRALAAALWAEAKREAEVELAKRASSDGSCNAAPTPSSQSAPESGGCCPPQEGLASTIQVLAPTPVQINVCAARLAVRLMAAAQEAAEEARRVQKESERAASGSSMDGGAPSLSLAGAEAVAPMLLASDGTLQSPSNLRWPTAELAALSPALQRALLEAAAADGSQQLLHPAVMALLAEVPPVPTGRQNATHQQQSTRAGANSLAPLRKAHLLVEGLRRDTPMPQQLSLASLVRRFLSSRPPAAMVVALTCHLRDSNQPQLVTHVLAMRGADAEPTLQPVHQCSVGQAYGNPGLERLQHTTGFFISPVYLNAEAENSTADVRMGHQHKHQQRHQHYAPQAHANIDRWRTFFVGAGASEGLSFVVSTASLSSAKLPTALRKSSKAVALPYGLSGALDYKKPLQLDVRFSQSSAQLLRTACMGSAPPAAPPTGTSTTAPCAPPDGSSLAAAFAELLGKLSIDGVEQPSATACPALAASIRGDAPDETLTGRQHGASSQANQATLSSRVPCRRRGLFLPAGAPGAALLDLGVVRDTPSRCNTWFCDSLNLHPCLCVHAHAPHPPTNVDARRHNGSSSFERNPGYRQSMARCAPPRRLHLRSRLRLTTVPHTSSALRFHQTLVPHYRNRHWGLCLSGAQHHHPVLWLDCSPWSRQCKLRPPRICLCSCPLGEQLAPPLPPLTLASMHSSYASMQKAMRCCLWVARLSDCRVVSVGYQQQLKQHRPQRRQWRPRAQTKRL